LLRFAYGCRLAREVKRLCRAVRLNGRNFIEFDFDYVLLLHKWRLFCFFVFWPAKTCEKGKRE
jgi:hypothetical protein